MVTFIKLFFGLLFLFATVIVFGGICLWVACRNDTNKP